MDRPLQQSLESPCLRFTHVAGTNATTQTLTGIKTEDTIVGAILFETTAAVGAIDSIGSDITITDDDEITFGSDYSNDTVLVVWHDGSDVATSSYSDLALRVDLIDGHGTEMAVTGMVATDVILHSTEFTTKADITTMADSTSKVTAGAGKVSYGSTTVDNLMFTFWLDSSA